MHLLLLDDFIYTCYVTDLLFYLFHSYIVFIFFFNDTATTEIYTLSLHDALPISHRRAHPRWLHDRRPAERRRHVLRGDRKSTRLNSSHPSISYAVFCLKKKKNKKKNSTNRIIINTTNSDHIHDHTARLLLYIVPF